MLDSRAYSHLCYLVWTKYKKVPGAGVNTNQATLAWSQKLVGNQKVFSVRFQTSHVALWGCMKATVLWLELVPKSLFLHIFTTNMLTQPQKKVNVVRPVGKRESLWLLSMQNVSNVAKDLVIKSTLHQKPPKVGTFLVIVRNKSR